MKLTLEKELCGSILDIGGGGEGIIGRLYKSAVTAIDNVQEELDEAPDCCKKLLMDAAELHFDNESFDNVTFFYSLMYMDTETKEKALKEACRVLKKGGRLIIWDSVITSAYPKAFLAELEIEFSGETVHTEYGIIGTGVEQDAEMLIKFCEENKMKMFEHEKYAEGFKLGFIK